MGKNILLLTVVSLLSWLALPSCNTAKKLIVKEWKVTKMEMVSDFSGSPKHMEVFKNFEEKARFTFNEDGTYLFDLVTEKQRGKWEIKAKGKMLITVSESGLQTDNTIFELTDSKLVMKNEKDENPIKLFLIPKE